MFSRQMTVARKDDNHLYDPSKVEFKNQTRAKYRWIFCLSIKSQSITYQIVL